MLYFNNTLRRYIICEIEQSKQQLSEYYILISRRKGFSSSMLRKLTKWIEWKVHLGYLLFYFLLVSSVGKDR